MDISYDLYYRMQRIRSVEEEIAKRYSEEKMRCPVHLSIGQEAISAGFSLAIDKKDFAVSTHRGHAHYLGKGGSLKSMIAEIYGKSTGCSNGKGGSMHLIDLDVNFFGTSAIVGNSIPVGVGLALSAKLKKTDQVSCVFLGDGAVEEGVFYESLNYSALKNLPVLYICENNLYSVYSPLSVRQPEGRSITKMVESIGVTSEHIESQDVFFIYQKLKEKIDAARNQGPQFIEFSTYRWREHCGPNYDNDIGYRSEKDFNKWKERDPISLIKTKLTDNKTIDKIHFDIDTEIAEAFAFAESSSFPDQKEAYEGVFLSE